MTIAWIRLGLLAFSLLWVCAAVAADEDDPSDIQEGKPAPNLELPATLLADDKDGLLKFKNLGGQKNIVLFFFPRAMTPGCTVESCGFRDLVDDFAKHDTVIIGISTDKIESQRKFMDKEKLTFPLMADADKTAAKAFGVLSGNSASRRTFVIDKKGIIRKIYPKVDVKKHPQEVLEFVKTLNKE